MSNDALEASSSSSVLSRDDGSIIRLGAITILVKEDGSRTNGALAMAEFRGKNFRIPPHAHAKHEETAYMIEGEMNLTLGDETLRVKAGDAFTFPVGVAHTTWHEGDDEARFLVHLVPASGLDYFRDLGAIAARERRTPTPDEIRGVMHQHGYRPIV